MIIYAFSSFLLSYSHKFDSFTGCSLRSFRDNHSLHYSTLCKNLNIIVKDSDSPDCLKIYNLYQKYVGPLYKLLDDKIISLEPNYASNKIYYPIFRALDMLVDHNFTNLIAKHCKSGFEQNLIQSLLTFQSKIKSNFICKAISYNADAFECSSLSSDNSQLTASNVSGYSNLSQSSHANNDVTVLKEQVLRLQQIVDQQQQQLQQQQQQPQQLHCQTSSQQSHSTVNSNLIDQELSKIKIQYKNTYLKKKRYESHIKYFDLYVAENKVPPALFHKNMPRPFLPSNALFVEEYNRLIREFQTATIKLCKKHVSKSLEENISLKLDHLKTEMANISTNSDILIAEICSIADTSFEKYAKSKEFKYSRLSLKEFRAVNNHSDSILNLSDQLDGFIPQKSSNQYNNRSRHNTNNEYNRQSSSHRNNQSYHSRQNYNNRSSNQNPHNNYNYSNQSFHTNFNRSVHFPRETTSTANNSFRSRSHSRNFRKEPNQIGRG